MFRAVVVSTEMPASSLRQVVGMPRALSASDSRFAAAIVARARWYVHRSVGISYGFEKVGIWDISDRSRPAHLHISDLRACLMRKVWRASCSR